MELKSIREGELKIGNLTIKVHVLNNGERVIEEKSVVEFLKWMESGEITQEQADKFAKELQSF